MSADTRSHGAPLSRRRLLAWAPAALLGAGRAHAQAGGAGELRIGFQKSAVNLLIVRERRLLDARLPGVAQKWVEFPAGPQLLEALAVGSIDFGFTGDSPPVFAQAAGKDVLYLGIEPAKPDSSAILVKPAAPLKTLADLRGKRVGLQKGSSAHYLLVRAVAQGGLQWSDITPVYLPPAEARAAFEKGAIDAWAIWDPYYAAAEIDAQARVLSTGRGLSSNNSFYLGSQALSQRTAVVKALFDALSEADAYVQSHRTEASRFIAEATGLPLASALRFVERRSAGRVTALTPAQVADQQRVADAFAQLGLIPKPIRVADAVWSPGGALAQAR